MTIPGWHPGLICETLDQAAGQNRIAVRLDQGFIYVRTVVLPHNPSGALFQRPAQRLHTPLPQEQRLLATAD
jgi:hypothetical protein